MKLRHLFVLACAASFAVSAHAEIYKRVDEDGHVTYSSAPIKGGKKLHLEPLPTMAAPPKQNKAAVNFPRVNSETQTRRDDTRRKILEDELASEQKALEEARAKLKEAEDNPEVYQQTIVVGKTKDGAPITKTVTNRNVAKYDEKVNPLLDEVSNHEKNIEALQTELANLK
ncbi:MAG: hypothetical protein A2100_02535 [Sideroxydans sp. GWF2_59_14]|nr:DUF4124 domain-containing protein [Sideroxyarcus sp.]OHC81622.1 MAG: hypothetical protein A2100_02535 [Sideroxydans sp. GWF2_59_14]HAF45219.1 DUF4124 domain-containing protein [Gallionellaceae bacterium]